MIINWIIILKISFLLILILIDLLNINYYIYKYININFIIIIIIIIFLNIVYICICIYMDILYKNRLEPLFAYFAMGFYLILIVPCILYTFFKLGTKFPYMKVYICSIIVSAILLVIHIAMTVMPSFRCSSLADNLPSEM